MKTTTTKETNGTAKPGVVEEVQALLAQQNEWKAGLKAAERKLAEVEAQVAAARRALATAEAAYFTKHRQMMNDDSPEAVNFQNAQQQLERARATCGGIRRAISNADIE